jgi:hypothetical protein
VDVAGQITQPLCVFVTATALAVALAAPEPGESQPSFASHALIGESGHRWPIATADMAFSADDGELFVATTDGRADTSVRCFSVRPILDDFQATLALRNDEISAIFLKPSKASQFLKPCK